jgi:hypothetical protein
MRALLAHGASLAAGLLAALLLLPSGAAALTLADLHAGASLVTADGALTFENWQVTTPDPVGSFSNSFVGLDLSLFEVEVVADGVALKVLETDGPLAVFGGLVGQLVIDFDVVADAFTLIDGVGLAMTGTAQGNPAIASIRETVVGNSETLSLSAFRIGGGTQQPTDSGLFEDPQTHLSVHKSIVLDTHAPGALLAQISEFEQSFQISPIPEPSAAASFAAGALVVLAALRRRAA